jgi:hypothetical protein
MNWEGCETVGSGAGQLAPALADEIHHDYRLEGLTEDEIAKNRGVPLSQVKELIEFDPEFTVTEDYPGFVIHNGRVTGSITLGHSRMPLWAPISTMIHAGYQAAVESWPSLPKEGSAKAIGLFLQDLFQQRQEFGRLLCVLADVERRERETRRKGSRQPWFAHTENVERARATLHNCLQHLDSLASRDYNYVVRTDADYEE